uniref:Ig-like domain-containing protein n=1 Tax=Stegastes partitus TaxID=144197 RepID=A0A3B4ZBA0_9TELE
TLSFFLFLLTYRVRYRRQHICAVKGSSVVFRCSFFYPDGERVQTVKWGHERHSIYAGPFIYDSELNNASSRFEYIGNRHHNCSLKIHQVEHNDAGKYTFRFTTDSRGGKWTGGGGPTLKIIDLSMVVSKPNGKETMKEGDSVNLTCVNSCDKLSSEFTWFKNGENITEGPVLHLRNMSVTNSGNYTCSLKSHTGTAPPVKHIDVECEYWTRASRVGSKLTNTERENISASVIENFFFLNTKYCIFTHWMYILQVLFCVVGTVKVNILRSLQGS